MKRSALRKMLMTILPGTSDLDAFIVDFFPEVYKRFSSGMDRNARINELFIQHESSEIFLKLCEAHPNRVKDWSVVAAKLSNRASSGSTYLLWALHLQGEFGQLDWNEIQNIINTLSKKCNKLKIRLYQISAGSIRIILFSVVSAFDCLQRLFEEEKLKSVCGHRILKLRALDSNEPQAASVRSGLLRRSVMLNNPATSASGSVMRLSNSKAKKFRA